MEIAIVPFVSFRFDELIPRVSPFRRATCVRRERERKKKKRKKKKTRRYSRDFENPGYGRAEQRSLRILGSSLLFPPTKTIITSIRTCFLAGVVCMPVDLYASM